MNIRSLLLPLIVLITVTLGFTSAALAQKIKIKKVKGLTALIETSVPLEEGQTYDLQTGSISADVNYSQAGFKSRKNSLTLGIDISALRGDNIQETKFAAQGRYGWNFSTLELGAVGEISSIDFGAGSTTNFTLGSYADYNLEANRDGKKIVYGPFGLLAFGSRQLAGGGSTGLFTVNAGGFLSYFFSQGSTALRVEAFVDHRQISASNGQTALTGVGSRGLLVFYF